MATSEIVICTAFRPLLEQACTSLGLAPPTYSCCDVATNESRVIVELSSNPHAYVISGGPGATVEESYERAAQRMLVHLMDTHGVCVYDVNLAKRDKADRTSAVFMLKRKAYENMEKGHPVSPKNTFIPSERIHPGPGCVKVDFFDILQAVVQRFEIHVTPVEYFEIDTYDHLAWIIVACPRKFCAEKVMLSDQCSCEYQGKQSVSKNAILFLMPIYNFLIEDANFHFLQRSTFSYMLERESYLTAKERIYGIKDNGQPQPLLLEEQPATPQGPGFRIPEGPPPPIPPKKRLSLKASQPFSLAASSSLVPPELSSCIKRLRMK